MRPTVAEGMPAAASRKYAIAAQQIVQNNLTLNNRNFATMNVGCTTVPPPTTDPSRPQTDVPNTPDSSIQFVDLTQPPSGAPVAVNGSYNAELFKQLSRRMTSVLRTTFPQRG